MKNLNILLIALRSSHNENAPWFQLGLAYIISSLRQIDVEPDVLCLDAYKVRMSKNEITAQLKLKQYDLIGFGFHFDGIYEALDMISLIREVTPTSKIIIGGAGPSSCPEYMLKKTGADILINGEGEITIKKLVKALSSGENVENVTGLYIWKNSQIVSTGPAIIYQDIDDCPLPAWDKFPMEIYMKTARSPATLEDNYMCVVTSRGCPYKCNFCFNANKYRFRKPEDIAYEIKLLIEKYNVTFIQFYDELFMASKKRAISLCKAFLREKLDFKYRINGRVNIVNAEILEALRESGCVAIGYGVESGDQKVLDFMNKKTSVDQIIRGVELTRKFGFFVTTPVIFGQPCDNVKTLHKTKDLVLQFTDGHEPDPRYIRPLSPYPGTRIYDWAVENGYLTNEDDFLQRFSEASDLTVNLTKLSDEDFVNELKKANNDIYLSHKKVRRKYLIKTTQTSRSTILKDNMLNSHVFIILKKVIKRVLRILRLYP